MSNANTKEQSSNPYATKQVEIDKRLDCQEVRFDHRENEDMQVTAGNVAVNDNLLVFLAREKKDIFNFEIQFFHCFHWQWVFFGVYTLGTVAAECLMEYKADSGHCGLIFI